MSTTTIEASSTIAAIETTETTEQRVIQHARRPIPFDTFIELSQGKDLELIDGVMVRRMSVQLEHEKLFNWLYRLAGDYVEERGLGILFGSRTAVEISEFKGRLPDLLFVRAERMNIVRQKAIYGRRTSSSSSSRRATAPRTSSRWRPTIEPWPCRRYGSWTSRSGARGCCASARKATRSRS